MIEYKAKSLKYMHQNYNLGGFKHVLELIGQKHKSIEIDVFNYKTYSYFTLHIRKCS